jgi:serine/threonine protein kinase
MSFGRYRELALIGQGGMARVVLAALASARGVQKLLVIKELHAEFAADAEYVGMFSDEARLATRLDHPNLIQTYEFVEEAGRHFFVMEYLDGQSYGALLSRTKRELPLALHLHVLTRVLAGLHCAHELTDLSGKAMDVVHRDVSPQNIFLCYGGAIKLVDFGIAKAAGAQVKTRAGTFKGKLSYSPAEQILNVGIDRRTDVFAAGVLLWEAICAKRITQGMAESAILHRRLDGSEPAVLDEKPGTPPELAAICDRALQRDPAERFATAAEMQAALDAFIEGADLRMTDAEVGAIVARAFETERSEVRRLIQQRLESPEENETTASLVLAPPASTSSIDTASRSRPSDTAATVGVENVLTQPARGSKRRSLVATATIGVALLALIIGVGVSRAGKSAPDVPGAAPQAPRQAASASLANPETAMIAVSFSATPSSARFTLDGIPLEGNPVESRRASDDNPHVLKVNAPGFVAEERQVRLDRPARIELSLTAEKGPPTTPHATSAAPTGDQATPRVKPVRPGSGIDETDPWAAKAK